MWQSEPQNPDPDPNTFGKCWIRIRTIYNGYPIDLDPYRLLNSSKMFFKRGWKNYFTYSWFFVGSKLKLAVWIRERCSKEQQHPMRNTWVLIVWPPSGGRWWWGVVVAAARWRPLPPHPLPDRGDRPGRRSGRPQPSEASGLYFRETDIVRKENFFLHVLHSFCVFRSVVSGSVSRFNGILGSGSRFAKQIRVQENKNDPQK